MDSIKLIKNKYDNSSALENVLAYCDGKYDYLGGSGIREGSSYDAYVSMKDTKTKFKKYNGRQLYRIVISVENRYIKRGMSFIDELENPNSFIRGLADDISKCIYGLGFQNCYFSNEIKDKFIQFHFIINTISYENGRRIYGWSDFLKFLSEKLKNLYPQFEWSSGFLQY